MRVQAWAMHLLAAALSVVSCAELFEEPLQCEFERDCAKFENATCDVARRVCVPKRAVDGGAAGSVATVEAGADAPDTRCQISPKPSATIPVTPLEAGTTAEITQSLTLDCTKDWALTGGRIFVRSGATLTIEAGTTIHVGEGSGLVISRGARIVASGKREEPIVFTSAAAAPAPGDWLGVLVLGEAPPEGSVGGLPYGGTNAADDAGTLEFVRIEYAQAGLVVAGAGTGTKLDFVQVRKSGDNCFVFQGGAVTAKHLVCQYPADEMIEFIAGFQGRAQFVFGQGTPTGAGHHGLLVDNASPTLYNATICGAQAANSGTGVLFRNNASLDFNDLIVTGWSTGLDALGTLGSPLELRGSVVFGNETNPAHVEDPAVLDTTSPTFDDDNGFDEIAWFEDGARANAATDPGLVGCFDAASPKPWPQTPLTDGAIVPPAEGSLDPNASYRGAFRDATDGWLSGWTRFGD